MLITDEKTGGSALTPESSSLPARESLVERQSNNNPWQLKCLPSGAHLSGNGEIVLTDAGPQLLAPGVTTPAIVELLEVPLHAARCTGRSIICFTDQDPFFPYLVQTRGAREVSVADSSESFQDMLRQTSAHLNSPAFKCLTFKSLSEFTEAAEIVIALSIDWALFTETNGGSANFDAETLEKHLGESAGHLAELTKYMTVIGWSPSPKSSVSAPLQQALFEKVLHANFKRVKSIGTVDGKAFYQAFKFPFEVDLRCPLPGLDESLEVVNCKLLSKLDGLDYWSRVYRGPDRIYKQTSFDLAFREYSLLKLLRADYFPKPLTYEDFGDYGVATMELVDGIQLSTCKDSICNDEKKFTALIWDCLQILSRLQRAGISHRDISEANILMRGEKPVLIDFSWGVTAARPMFTPDGLTPLNRDAGVSDVVSMGFMLKRLAHGRYLTFDVLFDLMTETNCDLRVYSATDLLSLFALLIAEHSDINTRSSLEEILLKNVVAGKIRLEEGRASIGAALHQARTESQQHLVLLEMNHERLNTEFARVLADFYRVEKEKNSWIAVAQERENQLANLFISKTWKFAYFLQRMKAKILRVGRSDE